MCTVVGEILLKPYIQIEKELKGGSFARFYCVIHLCLPFTAVVGVVDLLCPWEVYLQDYSIWRCVVRSVEIISSCNIAYTINVIGHFYEKDRKSVV